MKALARWTIFLLIGYPLQLLFNLLYIPLHFWWLKTQFKSVPKTNNPITPIAPKANHSAFRNGCFHNNTDGHNMLTHWGICAADGDLGRQALEDLVFGDSTLRRRGGNFGIDGWAVSGDCTVYWLFAYSLLDSKHKPKGALRTIVKGYLKNLGHTSLSPKELNGWVSARCNNFGLNYCPDGASFGIGQPMTGPQFFTSQAVFSLAAKELGGIWKLVSFLHFWLMGGPIWAFSPVLFAPKDIPALKLKKNTLGYVRDITMSALWVCKYAHGNTWWTDKAIKWINHKIAFYENAKFDAIEGNMRDIYDINSIDPWMFQNVRPTNRDGDSTNSFVKYGLLKLNRLAKEIDKQ